MKPLYSALLFAVFLRVEAVASQTPAESPSIGPDWSESMQRKEAAAKVAVLSALKAHKISEQFVVHTQRERTWNSTANGRKLSNPEATATFATTNWQRQERWRKSATQANVWIDDVEEGDQKFQLKAQIKEEKKEMQIVVRVVALMKDSSKEEDEEKQAIDPIWAKRKERTEKDPRGSSARVTTETVNGAFGY